MAIDVVTPRADVTARANEIYLRRRGRVRVPGVRATGLDEAVAVTRADSTTASAVANFHAIGYAATPALIGAMSALSLPDLERFHAETCAVLLTAKGGHRRHRPMYPNFPQEVMDADLRDLYLNAIVHYWTDGRWSPASEVKVRLPMLERVEPRGLDLGSDDEFERLLGQIVSANNSMSEADREDVAWFLEHYDLDVARLLPAPDAIPQRENRAVLASMLVGTPLEPVVGLMITRATDVLRLAAALSGGDPSLAEQTRFRLSRPQRRLLVTLLDKVERPDEDMRRHAERWKRLAHALHVGEIAGPRLLPIEETRRLLRGDELVQTGAYGFAAPSALRAVTALRSGDRVDTAGSRIEAALAAGRPVDALADLVARPGYLARRLDQLLRTASTEAERDAVTAAFVDSADAVATPILLRLITHFRDRFEDRGESRPRVFFPKGRVSRAQVVADSRPPVPVFHSGVVIGRSHRALVERFAALPPLGRVYVDPALRDCPIPHAGRSASSADRVVARGTRLALPPGDTVRLFMWWKNVEGSGDGYDDGRVDLDLSASLLDDQFHLIGGITYYNLRDSGGVHSGDVVDAPHGASEFVDYKVSAAAARGARYIAMTVNSYTGQRLSEVECFAGWMTRERPGSGEIYDPRTVRGRVDVTSPSRMVLPLLIDVRDRKAVWCDMSIKASFGRSGNNVHENRDKMSYAVEAIVASRGPSLHDLMTLHASARGTLVDDPAEADVVFSAEALPFEGEMVASEFMA